MATIFKCKMCGGALEINEDITVAECEYCGSKQTVPSADNEKKINLFTRANKLRAASEFDKASGVYESIVADFPEEAEAYWGLILCNYGIEYIDDLATGKKIPTCHRSSFDSVMDSSDFEMVMENADAVSRKVYREEAKAIEELRKSIIEVSSKEEPYDVFICYKETDEKGDRTIDSVIAQDVYTELTDKGYRVFFSRITLEDKLGQEYEPYIFAALNSAKVMLAIGTEYEYYNAVWVKNEWSRFLQLIEKGEKKTLIPCYKNIDAYDMPKEFARLQAQDMGKVGAVQDLLRGVEKIIGKSVNDTSDGIKSSAVTATVDSLLERAYTFLSDGEWQKAKSYFERILDAEPKNAKACLGRFCAEKLIPSYDTLRTYSSEFVSETYFARALENASGEFAQTLEQIVSDFENYHYEKGVAFISSAHQKHDFEEIEKAKSCFEKISRTRNAEELLKLYFDAVNKEEYYFAVNEFSDAVKFNKINLLENAVKRFEKIKGYSDSEEYLKKYEEIKKSISYRIVCSEEPVEKSVEVLSSLGDYKNSKQLCDICRSLINLKKKRNEAKGTLDAAKKEVKKTADNNWENSYNLRSFIVWFIVYGGIFVAAALALFFSGEQPFNIDAKFTSMQIGAVVCLFIMIPVAMVLRCVLFDGTFLVSILMVWFAPLFFILSLFFRIIAGVLKMLGSKGNLNEKKKLESEAEAELKKLEAEVESLREAFKNSYIAD